MPLSTTSLDVVSRGLPATDIFDLTSSTYLSTGTLDTPSRALPAEYIYTVSVGGGNSLVKLLADVVNIVETVRATRVLFRRFNETVQIEESVRRVLAMVRRLVETVEIAESTRAVRSLVRRLAEVVEILDAERAFRGLVRRTSEVVEISEVFRRTIGLTRRQSDTIQIRELSEVLRDSFDRADNALSIGSLDSSQAWTVDSGTAGISSNRGYFPSDIDQNRIRVEAPGGDGILSLGIKGQFGGTHRNPYPTFRGSGGNSHLLIGLNTGSAVRIMKRSEGGSYTQLATAAATLSNNVDYIVTVMMSGNNIKVYIDGVLYLDYDLTGGDAATYGSTAHWIGVALAKSGGASVDARFNNFNFEVDGVRRSMIIRRRLDETAEIIENVRRALSFKRIVGEVIQINESIRKFGVAEAFIRIINDMVQIGEAIVRRESLLRILNQTVQIAEARFPTLSSIIRGVVAYVSRRASAATAPARARLAQLQRLRKGARSE